MAVVHANSSSWQREVLESKVPVLVDFWAEWCGPCRALAPVLDQVATEQAGKLTVAKVNVDESPELAAQFGIRSIPTLLVFKQGQVQAQMLGNMSKAMLMEKLSAYLAAS